MMTVYRRFPRSSAALLVAGVAGVFLAAAAPAENPVTKAPGVGQPSAASATAPAMPAPASAKPAAPTAPVVATAPEPAQPAEQVKPSPPKQLSITIDQTRMVDLDGPISTVSVGNPAIADVNVQNQRIILTGKSFGRTNVVALSPTGEPVLDMMVFVTSSGGGSITVYKGSHQLTYNCAPNCDRTLMPGDSKEDFDQIGNQMATKMESGNVKRNE